MELDVATLGIVVPIVTVIVEKLKRIVWVQAHAGIQPWMSLAVGLVVFGAWSLWRPPDLALAAAVGYWIVHGIVAGLTASGLYSLGAKKLFSALSGK